MGATFGTSTEHHAAAILKLKVKPLRMSAGNEFADRLAAKGAEAHRDSEWTVKRIAGVRSGQDGAEADRHCHLAFCAMSRSLVSVYHWRSASGCPRMRLWLGRHVLAGLWQEASACLPMTCIPWQAKDALSVPLPLVLPAPDPPPNNFDQEDAEPQYEEDESQNDVWQAAFENVFEVEKSALQEP